MGLINVFNSVSNETKEIRANGTLKDILPDYDFNKCIVLKEGHRLDSHYSVNEEDVIFLRVIPGGVTAAIIAVTATVIVAGAALGCALYNKLEQLKEEQAKAQRNAQNLAQSIEQLPFIKGAKNKTALGNGIQYQFGRVYNTPYNLTDGFFTVSGNLGQNQYYNAVLSLGFNELFIDEVLIGDNTILKDIEGISSGVHAFDESSLYYDDDNIIEIRQPGEEFETDYFKYKVIATNDGAELKHDFEGEAEPLIRQIADNTKILEVGIQFSALRKYNSEAESWEARTATVRPYWSNDGGETWHEFYFSGMTDNTISANSRNTIRFVARKEFTPEEVFNKKITLKVEKVTPKAKTNSNEECYLAYYQSYCYDAALSSETELVSCKTIENEVMGKTCRIALRLKANDNTTNILDELHVMATAKAATWNGTQWTTDKQPSQNPAAVIYEVLTSGAHLPSKMLPNEIDLNSLGALYEHCEDNNYTCNGIVTNGIKKVDLLTKILNTCNATMYINSDGLYSFAIDKKENLPVALINAESIKNISYSKELKRKPDGLKVTYTNEKNWQIDTFYSMIRGGQRTQDDIITELNLEYITNYEHAYKMAQRYLRSLILQPRIFTVSVGKCGDYYPLYSVVLLQNKEFRQGLKSSTIRKLYYDNENNINALDIADYINFEDGKEYGVIIQAVTQYGQGLHYKKITGEGLTRHIELESAISEGVAPQLFNVVSIGYLNEDGEFDTITNKMKITEIQPDGANGFTLTLKDYNPAIYEFGEIPPYYSNITRPPKQAQEIPANSYQEIKGVAGEQGQSAFNYMGVFYSAAALPASTNGDFWLCGESFTVTEEIGVNGDVLSVNGDALGVKHIYEKGFIYYSTASGAWRKVENKNNYRYIIASNDLELLGLAISPALDAATVGKVYEETGLDSLEDKEIIDQETKTIKADLIAANTIKGITGLFDNITSNNGDFINATVTGQFVSEGGYRYYNEKYWTTGQFIISDIIEYMQNIFNDYLGRVHCYAELEYYEGAKTYRCYAIAFQQSNDKSGFTLRGYAQENNGYLTNFRGTLFKNSSNQYEAWLTIGSSNFHLGNNTCNLRFLY